MSDGDATDPLDAILETAPCPPETAEDGVRELRARNALVTSNLGLVHHHARRFAGRGVDHDDLVQVAAFGLMRAAELHDPARGAFGMYATIWIKSAMREAVGRARAGVSTGGTVEVEVEVEDPGAVDPLEALADAERAARVRAAVAALRASHRGVVEARFGLGDGRPRTLAETADLFGVSKQRIHQVEGSALATLRAVLGGV